MCVLSQVNFRSPPAEQSVPHVQFLMSLYGGGAVVACVISMDTALAGTQTHDFSLAHRDWRMQSLASQLLSSSVLK